MADFKPMSQVKQVTSVGSSEQLAEAAAMAASVDEELTIFEICLSWMYPMVLRTIVQLDVPHILATNHATNSPHEENVGMTAEEILQHIMITKKQEHEELEAARPNALNLERFLRFLTTKGIFAEHIDIRYDSEDQNVSNGRVERRFSLTPLSTCFVPGDGRYHTALLLSSLGPEYAASLQYLGDAVLKSEEPFTNAHGMNQFEYMKSHPEFLATFKNSFMDHAAKLVPLLLSKYHGFEGVWRLVDVGGNSSVILAGIVQKYPHIHAINFDLPEVVATNTSFPEFQVGGELGGYSRAGWADYLITHEGYDRDTNS